MNTRKKFGKARWIDTRLSKPYRRSIAGARLVMASGVAMAMAKASARIQAIRSSSFSGPFAKVEKAMAIADTMVGAMASAAGIAKEQSGRIADIKKRHGVAV